MSVPFVKSHGLGNDYLVLDGVDLPRSLSPSQVARICDRHVGIGSDGVLIRVPPWAGADFGLRIVNPDGSEAEKSGNGLRIFAKYLFEHGHTDGPLFTVDTRGGRVECQCIVTGGRVREVTVEMGHCSFFASRIPMAGPEREVVAERLRLSVEKVTITALSLGNPHCVVFTEELDEAALRRLGPMIEHDRAFPRRTNVQLARVASPSTIDALVWERGAGWTLASGSSACAVACAAVKNGLCRPGRILVRMPGGTLTVHVRPDWSVRLQGEVEELCSGTLSRDFLDHLLED